MDRRLKVELFEEIRREYEFGVGTIKGVAKKLGVHRRMVRQAVKDAVPPKRKPRCEWWNEFTRSPRVIITSPLRISLGGGGTDLPSYYRDHNGFVISREPQRKDRRFIWVRAKQSF